MNCIFVCVFNNEKYVNLFFILLESIYFFGNIDDTIHIVVYTSTPFMCMIKKHHLYNTQIKFEINDTYTSVDLACKSRLDLFNLPTISNYKKILYIDTDIIIRDDIHKVFDIIEDDVLYVLPEGELNNNIEDWQDYWGAKKLFGDELHNYSDKTAFTSGILLFNHCENMNFLFDKIKEDTIIRPHFFNCYDQPYIVYNSFKYNLYDNKKMLSVANNNCDEDVSNGKVIYHFPGIPGYADKKHLLMSNVLTNIKKTSLFYEMYSEKIVRDIVDFFIAKKSFHVAEIGNQYTPMLSRFFSSVKMDYNIDCLFISEKCYLSDLESYKNLKYIVFTDVSFNETNLYIERRIGENGIICSKLNTSLINKTYTWEETFITFLNHNKMNAFGEGEYVFIDEFMIQANFGGKTHFITFTKDFTEFSSIRYHDLQHIKGHLLPS
jgi:hypothetical protein